MSSVRFAVMVRANIYGLHSDLDVAERTISSLSCAGKMASVGLEV